jgi:hypothetical protein
MTKLLNKTHVKAMVKAMQVAGLKVNIDWQDGTVEAFYGDKSVYKALEKGKGQPWIVRHVDGLFV